MTKLKKNYNEGRKAHSMPLEISRQLENLKDKREFRSIGETVQYLLNIESAVKTEKSFKCEACGEFVEIYPGTDPKKIGLLHSHIKNTDCVGCISQTYKISNTKESNDNKDDISGKSQFWYDADHNKIETINGIEYKNGEKVVMYYDNDPLRPVTESDREYVTRIVKGEK